MTTSNTKECFRECIGKTIAGVLFDALPLTRTDLSSGNKTIVFTDGTGLTISATGNYWPESKGEIEEAVRRLQLRLRDTEREIKSVLDLAGVTQQDPTR